MTKEVLVSISGIQADMGGAENSEEPIEVFSPGTYYLKDGKHYIFYEEMMDGVSDVIKTQIRLKDRLEVIKKGILNTHMIFEENVTHNCFYHTPLGELEIGIYTKKLTVEEKEDNIDIRAEYILSSGYEPVADCEIRINVKPKGSKEFHIL